MGSTEKLTERIRYPLERSWIRWRLIRDLASGERTRSQLARAYGVVASSITEFAQRHASDIAQVKEELESELAGLWIADKRARIAEYQQMAEYLAALMAMDMAPDTAPSRPADPDDPDGGQVVVVGAEVPELSRAQARILKQIAEELGALPARVQVQVGEQRVHYTVEGVDLEALR